MPPARAAYISEGKLFLLDPNTPSPEPREVVSRFAQDLLDRDARRRQKDEWKRGSAGWAATSMPQEMYGMGAALGDDPDNPEARRVNITSVAPTADGKLLYALETDAVGGLFEYNPDTDEERRLVHRAEFRLADLDVHPDDGRVACCVAAADGSAHLAVLNPDGGRLREITEGDSLDQAPTWVRGRPDELVYQSAGIARNQHGHLVEVSPYRVERLNLTTGDQEVLFASDDYDCMMPRMDDAGVITYVRRPYRPLRDRQRPGVWPVLKDILMFPVRLAVAVVAFLNVFSMIFSKKPLITASGPRRPGPDRRQLFLYGRLIDAQQNAKHQRKNAGRAAVPDDWELVRSLPHGKEQVLATGVGHYSPLPDDAGLLYTDGGRVVRLSPDNDRRTLAESRVIERVGVTSG
ncbi:MAG: hypothetical protein AAFX76_06080 [Planctomycetota bacterium]